MEQGRVVVEVDAESERRDRRLRRNAGLSEVASQPTRTATLLVHSNWHSLSLSDSDPDPESHSSWGCSLEAAVSATSLGRWLAKMLVGRDLMVLERRREEERKRAGLK